MAAASAVALADTSTSATADTAGSAETPPPAAPLVTADGGTRPAPSVAEPPACGGGPGGRPRAAPPPKPRKRTRGKSRVAGVRARLLSHAPRAVGHLSRHAVPATGSASASPPSGVATAGAPAAAAPAAGAPPAAAGALAAAASGAGPDAAPAGTDRADAVPPTMSFEVLEAELAAAESDGGDGRGSTRDTSAERLPPADDGGSGASSAPTSRPRSPQLVAVAEATTGAGDRPPSSAPSGGGGGGGTGTAGVAPCKVATPADSNGGLGAFTPHSLLGKHLKGELARLSSSLESMLGRGVSPPAAGLILHIHGGGFISQSSLSHSVYTREWAAMLPDAVILSVDYSLAPEAQFPVALNETVHAYGWALANGAAIGTTASSVVVAGDSAGGNLAVALCLKVQELGMRPPDGLCLAYPALNLTNAWSPSRLLSFFDVLLPLSVLELCIQSYIPPEADPRNPLVSPLLMSDTQLAALPPLTCVVGSIDPLLDDAVTLATRMRRIGRGADVNLQIYESMPHGFLHMNHVIPEARHGMRVLARAMATYLQIPFKPDASGGGGRQAGAARSPSSTFVFDA